MPDDDRPVLEYLTPAKEATPEIAAPLLFLTVPAVPLAGVFLGSPAMWMVGALATILAVPCAFGGWIEHRNDSSAGVWALGVAVNAIPSAYFCWRAIFVHW